MRNRFDNQLAELNKELISMGALCENAIASAVKSLLESNTRLAASAIRIDHEIDRKEREIESMCLKLLLQQQPVASDLRLISSALKMITPTSSASATRRATSPRSSPACPARAAITPTSTRWRRRPSRW